MKVADCKALENKRCCYNCKYWIAWDNDGVYEGNCSYMNGRKADPNKLCKNYVEGGN